MCQLLIRFTLATNTRRNFISESFSKNKNDKTITHVSHKIHYPFSENNLLGAQIFGIKRNRDRVLRAFIILSKNYINDQVSFIEGVAEILHRGHFHHCLDPQIVVEAVPQNRDSAPAFDEPSKSKCYRSKRFSHSTFTSSISKLIKKISLRLVPPQKDFPFLHQTSFEPSYFEYLDQTLMSWPSKRFQINKNKAFLIQFIQNVSHLHHGRIIEKRSKIGHTSASSSAKHSR